MASSRPTTLVLLLVGGAVAWSLVDRHAADPSPADGDPVEREVARSVPLHPPALTAEEACRDVGYLCAEVEREGRWRALRWPDSTDRLRILVEEPAHEPPARARALRAAVVRALDRWQGHPLQLIVLREEREGPVDFRVRWVPVLSEARLGSTRLQWRGNRDHQEVSITDFVLATRSPHDERPLDVREVELSAAHEMGHALGLPHSDSPRDVMYAENTASNLTTRDYLTLEALYSLPNGVEIRRGNAP